MALLSQGVGFQESRKYVLFEKYSTKRLLRAKGAFVTSAPFYPLGLPFPGEIPGKSSRFHSLPRCLYPLGLVHSREPRSIHRESREHGSRGAGAYPSGLVEHWSRGRWREGRGWGQRGRWSGYVGTTNSVKIFSKIKNPLGKQNHNTTISTTVIDSQHYGTRKLPVRRHGCHR